MDFRCSRYCSRCIEVYREQSKIIGILERSEERRCVIVGPTTDTATPKKNWCRVEWKSLAQATRNGVKLLAVEHSRGDKAYEGNKMDLNEARELTKAEAALAKKNLVSVVPLMKSGTEPSHGSSAQGSSAISRRSASEIYPKGLINNYLLWRAKALCEGGPEIPSFEEEISRSTRTRKYFKDKKAFLQQGEKFFRSGTVLNRYRCQCYPEFICIH
ncbi:unnamed protein product [Heligmosomoides polygyrus]|uniref:DUF1738 domain-containing protein n=1 Tax=Heligmosomoides polygyrus TaxID=6339 RepID=A0A183G6Q6_HELPZ|nr:unnamed protein product [Heligmosomoides polygyrus]